MFVPRRKLEEAGIVVELDDERLLIHGTGEMPQRVQRAITEISDKLNWTSRVYDDLHGYVTDVTLWSTLPLITD